MEKLFLTLLEISGATALVILLVALLSSVINRSFVARWKYWIWLVLAVRLLLPFNLSFAAAPARLEVSIPNSAVTLPAAEPAQQGGLTFESAPDLTQTVPPAQTETQPQTQAVRTVTTMQLLMLAWAAGVAAFLLWQGVSYALFRRRTLRWSRPIEAGGAVALALWETQRALGVRAQVRALVCRGVSSPMMIGFFRPVLILPRADYDEQSLAFILRHELTHWQRRDIWYKALMLLANAVHWFNPAVWLMVREASRDLEISCDAAVVAGCGMTQRRQYSETILASVRREKARQTALSTHFYGGKRTLKERFINILSTKKRRKGALAFAAVLLCAGIVGGLVACNTNAAEYTGGQVTQMNDGEIAQAVYGSEFPRIIYASGERVIYSFGSVAVVYDFDGSARAFQTATLYEDPGSLYCSVGASADGKTLYPGATILPGAQAQEPPRFRYEIDENKTFALADGEARGEAFAFDEEGDPAQIFGAQVYHAVKKDGVWYGVGGQPQESNFLLASTALYVRPEGGEVSEYLLFPSLDGWVQQANAPARWAATDDFDGDGTQETFMLAGWPDQGFTTGWFLSAQGAVRITDTDAVYSPNTSRGVEVYDLGGGKKCAVFESYGTTASSSYIFTVENGVPVQQLAGGEGLMLFGQTPDGDFTATDSVYDFEYMLDGGRESWYGHTYKPYWFHWDGGAFREYTGTALDEAELMAYDGAREIVEARLAALNADFPQGGIVREDGTLEPVQWRLLDAYRRDNGIINVNYGYDYEYGGQRAYDNLRLDGNAVTLLDEPAVEFRSGYYQASMLDAQPPSAGAGLDAAFLAELLRNFGAVYDENGALIPRHISLYNSDGFTGDAMTPGDYFAWQQGYVAHQNENVPWEEFAAKYASPYGENTGYFYPQAEYEANVMRYFDVTAEKLRSDPDWYHSAEQGYWVGGGPGIGLSPVITLEQTAREGDLLHLYLSFAYDDEYATKASMALTVRLEADGGYKYVSYLPWTGEDAPPDAE